MQTNALVIMAAGFGSRYKGGIKQMTGVGPKGEWIMDYTIYDAYQAGIRKVIIIIREELAEVMNNHFSNQLPHDLELKFVYQSLLDIPSGFSFNNRIKPWGTGQAILCCKEVIQEPFIIVNADDYYGKEAFRQVNQFLDQDTTDFCMVGFNLNNTLSEKGGVNRGICRVDENLNLIEMKEIYQIVKIGNIAKGLYKEEEVELSLDAYCSLNLWGVTPQIFDSLTIKFSQFLENIKDTLEEEFLLPDIIQEMIQDNQIVKVIPTHDEWFGMTYQEDKELVETKLRTYSEEGKYPVPLWR